ncbi:hypothetical protein ACFQ3W_24755 [Paenibacillus puldeungensis]|uniref:Fluoroquinolone transport system permease protein n=1 Tax=Paenibacillus puldeungensis TaxID=696536 RepID=A0ABW3S5N4_9BACL
MKPLIRSFIMFVRQVFKDSMLVAVCLASVLSAIFIRYGVPAIEQVLCDYFQKTAILANYYLLFDLLLSIVTPYMLCFASAMVMLGEYDENLSRYLAVTPLGKRGYVLSRLVFPAAISFLLSVILMQRFSLTAWSFGMLLLTCLLSSLVSISVALLIFAVSHNRVEGMAVAKMAGLIMVGLPIPFFISGDVQYLFAPLPSFWIAKLCLEQESLLPFAFAALLSSGIWLSLLYHRFNTKLA